MNLPVRVMEPDVVQMTYNDYEKNSEIFCQDPSIGCCLEYSYDFVHTKKWIFKLKYCLNSTSLISQTIQRIVFIE